MLNTLIYISLIIGILSFIIIGIDILNGHRQRMKIMDLVYPITGLYAGPLALLVYFTIGRKSLQKNTNQETGELAYWKSVVKGALHCGSGCTLADIIAETALIFIPFTLFGKAIYGSWAVDYVLALAIGVIFQYYAIVPMNNLSFKEGVKKAFKADFFSLTSWQIGMYGWMAMATFVIFNRKIEATEPLFWFMMQIAMVCGFITAYPTNWLLIKFGVRRKCNSPI